MNLLVLSAQCPDSKLQMRFNWPLHHIVVVILLKQYQDQTTRMVKHRKSQVYFCPMKSTEYLITSRPDLQKEIVGKRAIPGLGIFYTRPPRAALPVLATASATRRLIVSFLYTQICQFRNIKKQISVMYLLFGSQNQPQTEIIAACRFKN